MASVAGSARYFNVKQIGAGGFGSVYLALDTLTELHVAIKYLDLRPEGKSQKEDLKYLLHEVTNHWRLAHPQIVQFKEVFLADQHLAIVMEYIEGLDMLQYVNDHGPLQECEARWFFQQLITAMDYLHRMDIADRDVKMENLLLDRSPRPLLKICDLGFSKHSQHQSSPKSMIGTLSYMAPELLQPGSYNGKISDVWACGVVLFAMLTSAYPFARDEDEADIQRFPKTIQRIKTADYEFPRQIRTSASLLDLLNHILVVEPERRITVAEIRMHPWYLLELPSGVSTANDAIISQPFRSQVHQSLEEVTMVVHKALAIRYSEP